MRRSAAVEADQSEGGGAGHRLGPAVDPQPHEDQRQVVFHRAGADAQVTRDLLARAPLADPLQHLELALGQRRARWCRVDIAETAAAGEHGAHRGDDLVRLERLRQVAAQAQAPRPWAELGHVGAGQQDTGRARCVGAHLFEQLQAVAVGQPEIGQHHRIRRAAEDHALRLAQARRGFAGEPDTRRDECTHQRIAVQRVVVDHEDTCCRGWVGRHAADGSQHDAAARPADWRVEGPRIGGSICPTMNAPHCPLDTLIQQAWLLRFRDPQALVSAGGAIVDAAAGDVAGAGWGQLHRAWGLRFRAELPASSEALAEAERCFGQADDRAGRAACRVLRAYGGWLTGDLDQALATLALDELRPGHGRHPLERQIAINTRASVHYAMGRWDEALRDRYAALEAARESGHAGAIGHALGLLGGQQADYANLEDALRVTTEGAALCAEAGATHAGIIASMNRLNALVGIGQHAEALRLSEQMHAIHTRIPPAQQEQAFIQFAWATALAGQPERAQALLDRSVALRVRGHLHEWTLTQAEIWNAQGRHAEARVLCEDCLASRPTGINSNAPAEWLRTHQAAAVACEALGDLAATVHHQREGQRLYEELVGRSARAKRLTLEIEFDLERERRERDEAERRHAAAEAERARVDALNHALEAASLAKSRFLAAASHDLRQPVHALSLQVAALRAHLTSAPQFEMAARIDRCVGALAGMFNTLLDLSRIDAGVVEPEPRPVALPMLLARLVEEQWPEAQRKGLRLALRLPPGAATAVPTALSDPALLERALRNLVVNALKYTRTGGVLLSLRQRRHGQRGACWRIEVWDTGIGITPADQGRVFDEFYQVARPEPGDAAREEGLGLGLAIVQRLAQLLGHTMALRSVPGRGTRLSLDLPRCPASPPGPPSTSAIDSPLGLHLAVIEDDAEVRDAMRSLFGLWGCEVSDGDSAETVLAALQGRRRPDAVLADLRLAAGRSGLDEVARLRAATDGALPALMVTGDTSPAHLRSLQASGLPWLAKPVAVAQLRVWLAALG